MTTNGTFSMGCPHCGVTVEISEEFRGIDVACSECEREFRATPPEQKSRGMLPPSFTAKPNSTGNSLSGMRCPFCQSSHFSAPQKKFTTSGIILLLVGICFILAIVGIIMIAAAYQMRETKYQCLACQKWI